MAAKSGNSCGQRSVRGRRGGRRDSNLLGITLVVLVAATLGIAGCGAEGQEEPATGDMAAAEEEELAGATGEFSVIVNAPPALVTHERGGEAEFSLVLDGAPPGEFTIRVGSSDPGEGYVTPRQILFDSENWSVAQTVTVWGVDDDEADGNQPYTISIDPVTEGLAEDSRTAVFTLDAINADDDEPGLTVQREVMSFSEAGGEGAFKLLLNSEPDGEVAVQLGCTDGSEALFIDDEGATGTNLDLVFTPEDWSEPRQVVLLGQDDDRVDGDQVLNLSVRINADATTDTTGYAELAGQAVEIVVTDDDAEGITVQILRSCQIGG